MIEIGRGNLAAVTTNIGKTHVIHEDDDDIRTRWIVCGRSLGAGEEERSDEDGDAAEYHG
jgi:hypothetical protein